MSGVLERALRGINKNMPELPAWAKEIGPYMDNIVVASSEINNMVSGFYPSSHESPPPNKVLVKAKILVVWEAIKIAQEALDQLAQWAEREE